MHTSDPCPPAMYGMVTIGAKGQIVIPKEVRDLLNLQPGDNLIVLAKSKAIGLVRSTDLDEVMKYLK